MYPMIPMLYTIIIYTKASNTKSVQQTALIKKNWILLLFDSFPNLYDHPLLLFLVHPVACWGTPYCSTE